MKNRFVIFLMIIYSLALAFSCSHGSEMYEIFFEEEKNNGGDEDIYTATFHLNGGVGFTDGIQIKQKLGEPWNLPPTMPSWIDTSKKFIGWNTDGTVETFLNTSSWAFTEDKDIYAIYSANPVLDWYFAGGVPAAGYTPSGAYAPGTAITAPATVTRTGYTFTGWTPAFTGTMPDTDVTYSAQLNPITYTVHFDGNGATSGTVADEVFTYDSPFHLNTNEYLKTENVFKGWNTASDGSGTNYTDEQIVNNLASTQGAVVTLYAKWNPLYTISYTANGADSGSVPSAPVKYEKGTTITILGNTGSLAKSDPIYEFKGWNTAADGSGKSYLAGSSFTITENLNLYSRWKFKGSLNGDFSVGVGKKVNFAQGDLYYNGTSYGFEAEQYDVTPVGNTTWNPSHVCHFFWSKDASIARNISYSGAETSTDVLFTNDPSNAEAPNSSFTVETGVSVTGKYRTLTTGEFDYLLSTRPNATNLRSVGTITGCPSTSSRYGLIILADDFILPSGCSFTPGYSSGDWSINTYTQEQWAKMESAGALFLPALGFREKDTGTIKKFNNDGNGDFFLANVGNDIGGGSGVYGSKVNFRTGNAVTSRSALRSTALAIRMSAYVE